MIITDDVTNPQIINPTAGTVDYVKGEVKLTNFKVEAFNGSAIKITAKTIENDIKAPQGRVFILRDTDIKIVMDLVESGGRATATQAAASTSNTLTSTGSGSAY
jgi:hypothetical protein